MDWLIHEVFSQAAWIGETLAAADPANVGLVFSDECCRGLHGVAPLARMQAGLQRAEREFASLPPDVAAEIRKLQRIVNGAVGAISYLDTAKYYAGTDLAGCGRRGWSAAIRHIKSVPFPAAESQEPASLFPFGGILKIAQISPFSGITKALFHAAPALPEKKREANAGGAELVEPIPGKAAKRKQGRPADTDAKEDKRIFDAWKTGRYRTQADCDQELGLPAGATYAAVERHRKRLARRNKRRGKK